MRSTSDTEAYARLVALSKELDDFATTCWSPVTEAAIKTAALFVRRLASAVYEKGVKA